jgi:hypothetical protein
MWSTRRYKESRVVLSEANGHHEVTTALEFVEQAESRRRFLKTVNAFTKCKYEMTLYEGRRDAEALMPAG